VFYATNTNSERKKQPILRIDAAMAGNSTSLKSVLISGGTGFLGAATARAVAEKYPQCDITIIDLHPPGPSHVVPDGASFVQVGITNADEVNKALQQARPDVVIHTAGIVPALAERFGRRIEEHVWRVNVDSIFFR
jgi:sterol-4alpha-carboxylate 3-dehydrogenase (decarboxylating)